MNGSFYLIFVRRGSIDASSHALQPTWKQWLEVFCVAEFLFIACKHAMAACRMQPMCWFLVITLNVASVLVASFYFVNPRM